MCHNGFTCSVVAFCLLSTSLVLAAAPVHPIDDSQKTKLTILSSRITSEQKILVPPLSKDKRVPRVRLLIKFRQQRREVLQPLKRFQSSIPMRTITQFREIKNLRVIEIESTNNIVNIIREIASDPTVEYVERDHEIYPRKLANDSQYSQQWGLENAGVGGVIDADINSELAWDITTGNKNIVVAVIDTGVTYTHVDLKDNMWRNPNEIPNNNIDDDNNGYIDDIFGIDSGDNDSDPMANNDHGTHIAGIIAAKGNNGIGIAGINWNTSILACKIFSTSSNSDLIGFVSSAIECIDYIVDLKRNKNINIVAANASWGWTGAYSQALADAIKRMRDVGILFVVASGNDSVSNDVLIDYPSTYHLSNILSVAATNQSGQHTIFTNYGGRTISISAPGEKILSTLSGSDTVSIKVNTHVDIFSDTVEQGVGGWTAQAPWEIVAQDTFNGLGAWTDSPLIPYGNNINSSLTSKTFNLSTFSGANIYLGFFAKYALEDGFDLVHIEFSGDNGKTWILVGHITGFTSVYKFFEFEIPSSVKTTNFKMRFRLNSDETISDSGILLDNIGIGSGPALRVDDRYGLMSGTSMAAPYVTGSLALLKAQDPTRNWVQLKNLVIAGGKPFSTAANVNIKPTISNRSLRLVDVKGVGSMSCLDQVIKARLRPSFDNIDLLLGSNETLNIAYLHINCAEPAGALSVTLVETGDQFQLLDDGLGFDHVAGDGVYSANIDVLGLVLGQGLGVANFRLPDGDLIRVTGKKTYIADDSVAYNWRTLNSTFPNTLTPITFATDDSTEIITSPFPISFDDSVAGIIDVGINENGFIALLSSPTAYQFEGLTNQNNIIPNGSTKTMVAPFWEDLTGISKRVSWGILGVQPNRELVVQWENIPRVVSTKAGIKPSLQGATFQVVFFEDRSDVLFNYKDVIFGAGSGNRAASATIGIQSTQLQGRTYSYNNSSISNQSAILWRTVSLVNFPPEIAPISDKFFIAGQSISFIVDTSDANGVRPILTATGIPNGAIVDFDTGQFDWIDTSLTGDYSIQFSATDAVDSNLVTRLTVNIRIIENTPPVITAPAEIRLEFGNDVDFFVTAIDQNGHVPIISVSSLPENAIFDVSEGRFLWSYPPLGSTLVEFIATDGLDAMIVTRQVVPIVVIEKAVPVDPPIQNPPPDDTPPANAPPTEKPPESTSKRGLGSIELGWLLLFSLYILIRNVGVFRRRCVLILK